jgi:hypothetical protein
LIQSSVAVLVKAGQINGVKPLTEMLETFDLRGERIPNMAINGDTTHLQSLLPDVIAEVSRHLSDLRKDVETSQSVEMKGHLQKLEALRNKHVDQIELDFGGQQPEAFRERRKRDRLEHIDRVFKEYKQWLEETHHTEHRPYVQVIAVLTGDKAVAVSEGEG